MTDTASTPTPPVAATQEHRLIPAAVYVLYLLGPLNIVTYFIGLLVAYFGKTDATPKALSHLVFQIRSFWLFFAWAFIGCVTFLVGLIGSVVLVGLPILGIGIAILSVIHFWFIARSLIGAYYLLKDEAYPRPQSWLF